MLSVEPQHLGPGPTVREARDFNSPSGGQAPNSSGQAPRGPNASSGQNPGDVARPTEPSDWSKGLDVIQEGLRIFEPLLGSGAGTVRNTMAMTRDQMANHPGVGFAEAAGTAVNANLNPMWGAAEALYKAEESGRAGRSLESWGYSVKAAGHTVLAAAMVAGALPEATAAKPFAMGLWDEGLEAFANARGATTWKQLPDPANWRTGVVDKLADPKTQVHFNLDGVDVWQGLGRAASGRGGPTDWELLTIKQNPQFWDTLQFWKGGQPVANPFQ